MTTENTHEHEHEHDLVEPSEPVSIVGTLEIRDERDTFKKLRESLAVAAVAIDNSGSYARAEHLGRLGRLIDEIDRQRPLGPDGSHGNRHTLTCQCEDRGEQFRRGRFSYELGPIDTEPGDGRTVVIDVQYPYNNGMLALNALHAVATGSQAGRQLLDLASSGDESVIEYLSTQAVSMMGSILDRFAEAFGAEESAEPSDSEDEEAGA